MAGERRRLDRSIDGQLPATADGRLCWLDIGTRRD